MATDVGTVTHCRVWWPKHLCVIAEEVRALALVGWVSAGADFLDLVVVAAVPTYDHFSVDLTRLQRCLESAESKLPAKIRTERKLCVIGEYHFYIEDEIEESCTTVIDVSAESKYLQDHNKLSASLNNVQHVSRAWAVFLGHTSFGKGKNLDSVPNLYRIIRDEGYVVPLNTHIIVYSQPKLGSHHYSCLPWSSSHKITNRRESGSNNKQAVKKPMWLSRMEQKESALKMVSFSRRCLRIKWMKYSGLKLSNLLRIKRKLLDRWFLENITCGPFCAKPTLQQIEMIMMKLNCARFIDQSIREEVSASVHSNKKLSVYINIVDPRRPIAIFVTVWATFLYCLARTLAPFLAVRLPAVPLLRELMQKSMLLQILPIRCQQLMAWLFMLLWGGLGPEQPNVADANRVAIRKHSIWFSLLIDKIAGAIVGCLVLNYHSTILNFLLDSGQSLTNDVLRTGCVWLMGVPAGFKINSELAAVFGTLSLHWIQTWSTLLFTSIPAIKILLFVLGLTGIVMGFTIFASLVSDMISLSTVHVLSLHDAIGFIYSNQLRALAALFRLFRGRKRNILRGRLDSFDCSVEQLLVGSLMFTPLLLLLPTTSVFYTFFSIIFMTVSSIQLSIHYVISILLCFPFCEVAAWFLHPKEFPSGVWTRMVQLEKSLIQTSTTKSPSIGNRFQKDVSTTSILGERSKLAVPDQRCTEIISSEMEATFYSSRNFQSRGTNETHSSESKKKENQKTTLISTLEIRTASFGELLRPFLETHYSGLQWPSAATLASNVVSGERFNRKLYVGEFSRLPYTSLSVRRFAQICYTTIMGNS